MSTKRRVDITNLLSALDDMIVKAGVIKYDNRNIVASHYGSLVLYDKVRARIAIEIKLLFDYNIWQGEREWIKSQLLKYEELIEQDYSLKSLNFNGIPKEINKMNYALEELEPIQKIILSELG